MTQEAAMNKIQRFAKMLQAHGVEMDAEVKEVWIQALYSGRYTQITDGSLEGDGSCRCVLGVLSDETGCRSGRGVLLYPFPVVLNTAHHHLFWEANDGKGPLFGGGQGGLTFEEMAEAVEIGVKGVR